jgi:hypothetical protein
MNAPPWYFLPCRILATVGMFGRLFRRQTTVQIRGLIIDRDDAPGFYYLTNCFFVFAILASWIALAIYWLG